MADKSLSTMKGVSARDRKMIAETEAMMGPEPDEMGFAKNLFWGRFRNDLVFPYPQESQAEREKCDALLEELEAYLRNEHPAILIDQEEYIPDWAFDRLFEIGVMGMTIPEEYGGLGLGVTSYNRVLELIGSYCSSTAVVVSAHQSIGCKAIMLFGTDAQKERYLPKVAREYLSGFCLSEPQVGSDAAGQETRCELSEDGTHYILNGEKKWTTSGALAGLFTVMAKQRLEHPETGEVKDGVTALICTPDMEGVDIFEKNRSKTGIRGTWQARIRLTDVKVPAENRLHKEGKGLNVALTCLNYGRCTLSAGVSGAARRAMNQATKWVQTRYQFGRPLADFELVQERIAKAAAFTYAMDAMLYMMTGMLDRGDTDIMVETAMTKVFCSERGWEVIDDAMEIMGGEGYVTENEFERLWRDNRIHRIVEGSNEVMQSFIFAYGGRQLAQQMISIQDALLWDTDESIGDNISRMFDNGTNPAILSRALPLGAQLFLGVKPTAPQVGPVHPTLERYADRLGTLTQLHSHYFKLVSKWEREKIVSHQTQQARVADNAIYLYALTCSLSKMDHQLRQGANGIAFERDQAAFEHLFDLLEHRIRINCGAMRNNPDDSMRKAAEAARRHNDTLPNGDFYIHESSPVAAGTGKTPDLEHIKTFPGDDQGATPAESRGDGAPADAEATVEAANDTKKTTAKKK
jgi:alkylation response protein AidB-like acyl-CoA dehydrogenase